MVEFFIDNYFLFEYPDDKLFDRIENLAATYYCSVLAAYGLLYIAEFVNQCIFKISFYVIIMFHFF